MNRDEIIKKYADEISFRLLATNKTVDQPWLEEKLHDLCNNIDLKNLKKLENQSESEKNFKDYMGNN